MAAVKCKICIVLYCTRRNPPRFYTEKCANTFREWISLNPTALVSGGSFYFLTNDNVGRTVIDLPKMINPGRWLTENGKIPEDDLPRMAKSRKMTYREWPNPGRFFFVYFFGGLECVGHSFADVAHLWFLRDVWIRTQSAAVASWRATDLATHPLNPKLVWIRIFWYFLSSR